MATLEPAPSARPLLSIVVPVHNEAAILESTLHNLRQRLEDWGIDHEILVCENGSSDDTARIARQVAAVSPSLLSCSLPEANYGRALRFGFLKARGRYVAAVNIDFIDFAFLEQALAAIEREGVDMVIGSKVLPGSVDRRPLSRRFLTRSFNWLLRRLFGTRLSDTHGLKLLRTGTVQPLIHACELEGEVFDTELLLRAERAGLRLKELPVVLEELRPSRYAVWRRIPSTIRDLAHLVWYFAWRIRGEAGRKARQQFYDSFADSFDDVMNRYDLEKRLRIVFDQSLRGNPLRGRLLLDAGCGTGEFSRRAAAAGARVVALDIGPRLVQLARRKVGGLLGVVGDLTALPMPDGVFDYVICSEAIEHTVIPRLAVSELCRVLRPGGTLVVTVPNRAWGFAHVLARFLRLRPYHGNEHWVTARQLRRWVAAGSCRVERLRGFHLVPFMIPATHPLLDACDRWGGWLYPIMLNLSVVAEKTPAYRSSSGVWHAGPAGAAGAETTAEEPAAVSPA